MPSPKDPKRVVYGKSVHLGGRRIIKIRIKDLAKYCQEAHPQISTPWSPIDNDLPKATTHTNVQTD